MPVGEQILLELQGDGVEDHEMIMVEASWSVPTNIIASSTRIALTIPTAGSPWSFHRLTTTGH